MRTILLFCLTSIFSFVHSYEVFTISDSIVDHLLRVDEEFIDSIPGRKGESELVDNAAFEKIIQTCGSKPIARTGASAVNSLKAMQLLGHSCGLLTTVGEDKEGKFFLKSLKELGIALHFQTSSVPTGKSACLVTPNGERTMRTYLGASTNNDRLSLHPEMFQGVSHFHVEGYQLKHNQLINQAIAFAKQNGASISLGLSSSYVVSANKNFIWNLLAKRQIDLILANQEEAEEFTGLPPKEAADLLASYCPIAVVTMGENGCVVSDRSGQFHYPACSVAVVDTTGAGDLFMSGFLHGYLSNQPLYTCARWGTQLAAEVIQILGAEIPDDQWQSIKQNLKTH